MDRIPNKQPAGRQPTGRQLKMVGKESMHAMLDVAVSRALGADLPNLGREQVRALQERVREQFQELLSENARSVQGVSKGRFLSEMDASRQQILRKRSQAEAEMGVLERQSAMLRSLYLVGGPRDGSSADFEVQLEAQFRKMSEEAGPAVRRSSFPADLARSAAGMARAEWKSILDRYADNANDEIDQYRRRIQKLSAALTETEDALDAMSKLKEGDPGLSSIYRSVRGIDEDGAQGLQRRAILTSLFKRNKALQGYRLTS